jgi:hypothetical protein
MRRLARAGAAAVAGWVMAVCPVTAQSLPPGMVRVRAMPPTYAATAPEGVLKAFERPAEGADVAYAFLANKTRLLSGPGVPLQVSYTAPDGAVVLWHLGTGALHRGKWMIEERRRELIENGVAVKTRADASICFDYGGSILAPEWQRGLCLPMSLLRKTATDRREGDVLGLAKGAPPPLGGPRNIRSLNDLVRRP